MLIPEFLIVNILNPKMNIISDNIRCAVCSGDSRYCDCSYYCPKCHKGSYECECEDGSTWETGYTPEMDWFCPDCGRKNFHCMCEHLYPCHECKVDRKNFGCRCWTLKEYLPLYYEAQHAILMKDILSQLRNNCYRPERIERIRQKGGMKAVYNYLDGWEIYDFSRKSNDYIDGYFANEPNWESYQDFVEHRRGFNAVLNELVR